MCLREVTDTGQVTAYLEAFEQGQHLLTKHQINTHIHTVQGKDLLLWDSQMPRHAWST